MLIRIRRGGKGFLGAGNSLVRSAIGRPGAGSHIDRTKSWWNRGPRVRSKGRASGIQRHVISCEDLYSQSYEDRQRALRPMLVGTLSQLHAATSPHCEISASLETDLGLHLALWEHPWALAPHVESN